MSRDDTETKRASLLRELADGSAGPIIRFIVTTALAAAMAGGTLITAYALAALNPSWSYNYGRGAATYPKDELVAFLFFLSGAAFLAITTWLWWRHASQNVFVFAIVATLILFGITVALCTFAVETLTGDEEIVVAGIVLLAFAAAFLTWLQCYRIHARSRPARNPADGQLDLRCPRCNYRMVGLHEARCPECGTTYTLDDLLARQNFAGIRAPRDQSAA